MHALLVFLIAVCASDPPPPAGATGVTLDFNGGPLKVTGEEAALRAVRAMAAHKLQFAEICPDGTIRGYSETLSALVIVGRLPDGQAVPLIFVAGYDRTEAQRVRIGIFDDIVKGPATDEKAVRTFGTAIPAIIRKAPRIEFYAQERAAAPILKHFAPAASIALDKAGFESKVMNPIMVGGSNPYGGTSLLTSMPTANAQVGAILCVTAWPRADIAASSSKALVGSVIKILYE